MKTEMKVDLRALEASIYRDSFFEFFKHFWPTIVEEELQVNWHMKYLCEELQTMAHQVHRGEAKEYDLVINISPGSSKSTLVSQMFPAWVWTWFPSARFIGCSYAYDVALKDSIRTRDIVQSEDYQRLYPHIQLREDQNTKGLFVNTAKGFRYSVGILGAITGYHGHFLLVDDPLNPEESYSEADLKKCNRWMSTTLPSRKVDKKVAVTILIQQRLHQADPSGEALAKKKKIKHICLPGELTDAVRPVELRQFYTNGLMDPVRLSREVLDEMKSDLGAYGYAAQVLQDPVPLGGGMFDTAKIKLEDTYVEKHMVRKVRSWDKAGTDDGGCWSVGVLMALDKNGEYWVLDVVRGQWGSTKREATIEQTADLDGEDVEQVLEIEGGSGGKESGENTVKRLAGYRVTVYHPTGDKEARAYPYSSQMGGGTVHVLKREWTREYVEELRYFPHSKYKDQVDASSGAFNRLARRKRKVGGLRL